MSTKVIIKEGTEVIHVKVSVTELNEWVCSYISSFNGEHKRNSENQDIIELGNGAEMIGRIDNWRFLVEGASKDTLMTVTWFQGGEMVGQTYHEGKPEIHIYDGTCEFKIKGA